MNPAIKKLESQASKTLLALLDDMFASCDDLFFDLASRADNNLEQNLFFESMREVRVHIDSCQHSFKEKLSDNFASIGKNDHKKSATPDLAAADLSLVGEEEAELDVAISSMTSRARVAAKRPLYELQVRIESLFSNHFEEEDCPLDPMPLIRCFVESTRQMELDIKARIILLKQYERYIINRLPEIYVNANKLLESLGVKFVDERKNQKKPGPRSGSSHNVPALPTTGDEGLLPDTGSHYAYSHPALSELSGLLGRLRSASGYQSPTFAHAPLFASPGLGNPLTSEALLQLLESTPQPETVGSGHIDLREHMRELIGLHGNQEKPLKVQQIDEDIINLVAMFFDFVLDDHNIPDNLRALIGRLQMPVLKIAIRDKTFFTNTEHPCRHFINELSSISIGVASNDQSAMELMEQVEHWVQAIQNNTDNTIETFSTALEELNHYAAKMRKRAELVEKRTSESARGEARKQVAKMKAQKAIQEAMDGKIVARPVADFIVNLWQQVLYHTEIRDGDDSPGWLAELQTMQDLIWCSQAHEDEKSAARLERIRPELLGRLQKGLATTTINESQAKKLVREIDACIDKVASRDDADIINIETFQAEKESKLDTLQSQKTWKEMTALERQKQQHEALTYEYIERADAIAVGSWLEFKVPASGTTLRCKLAAKLEESDTYIFVNRLGFKTMERARKDFAFDLQRKRARILKTGPLFDRSLHKLVSSLKNSG